MIDTSYQPVHAYLEAGPKRPARVRRQAAARMRDLRKRHREDGRPDPATLDRAIADALRAAIAETVQDGVARRSVDVEAVILGIAEHLRMRSERSKAGNRQPVTYRREAVSEAIYQRLLAPGIAQGNVPGSALL